MYSATLTPPTTEPTLDKREVRIQRMFGQIAPWYDFLNHFLSLNIDKVWRRWTITLVPIKPERREPVLDLCTGTGDLALGYARSCPTTRIIGADFCHEMLVRADQKSTRTKSSQNITFIEADAQALPFPDEAFQLVSIAFGLRNVTDTDQGLREICRVLHPGGTLAVLEFSKPSNRIFRKFYLWYFRYILPKVGQLLARNQENAYSYLPASVLQFPDGEEMLAKLRSHGLKEVRQFPFTFGIATLYVGQKT